MSTFRSTIEALGCHLEVAYIQEGRYLAAGRDSPAEAPYPVVQSCRLHFGEYVSPKFGFDQLTDEQQERVLSELQDEIAERHEREVEIALELY